MEDRAFTLRLTSVEIEALEGLKDVLSEKTDTKIIRYVIQRFKAVADELAAEKNKNAALTKELTELKKRVGAFNEALEGLRGVLSETGI